MCLGPRHPPGLAETRAQMGGTPGLTSQKSLEPITGLVFPRADGPEPRQGVRTHLILWDLSTGEVTGVTHCLF